MLKLKLTKKDGRPLYVMGLSHKNVQELLKGNPIPVHLTEFGDGIQAEVLLYAGETEDSMIDDLIEAKLIDREFGEAARQAMNQRTRQ